MASTQESVRTAYEDALREREGLGANGLGANGTGGSSSSLKWLILAVVGAGVAYGAYELLKAPSKSRSNGSGGKFQTNVRTTGGRNQFWYGTTTEIDFSIGKAKGHADAKKKARAIIASGRRGTRRDERLTGVYWIEGGRFA